MDISLSVYAISSTIAILGAFTANRKIWLYGLSSYSIMLLINMLNNNFLKVVEPWGYILLDNGDALLIISLSLCQLSLAWPMAIYTNPNDINGQKLLSKMGFAVFFLNLFMAIAILHFSTIRDYYFFFHIILSLGVFILAYKRRKGLYWDHGIV